MAAGRDYRAEYQARIARGQARGLTTSQARGHARVAKGEGTITQLVGEGRIAPSRRRAPQVRKVIRTPAGTIVNADASDRTKRIELRRAAANGQKVAVLVTVRTGPGADDYATRWLTGQQYNPSPTKGALGDNYVVSTRLVIGDADTIGGGVDPDEILDILDEGGDWNDVIDHFGEKGEF